MSLLSLLINLMHSLLTKSINFLKKLHWSQAFEQQWMHIRAGGHFISSHHRNGESLLQKYVWASNYSDVSESIKITRFHVKRHTASLIMLFIEFAWQCIAHVNRETAHMRISVTVDGRPKKLKISDSVWNWRKIERSGPITRWQFQGFSTVKNLTTKQQPPIRRVTPQTELNKTCPTNPTALNERHI